MERANKCTVQTTATGFQARFVRTHKDIRTIDSTATTWESNPKLNATANRELFRLWIQEHAQEFGIAYDPDDRRTADNLMPARYDSDQILTETAGKLITSDIQEWAGKIHADLQVVSIVGESIQPTTTHKGKSVDPKYTKSGAWAWATISVVATFRMGEKEGYVTLPVTLVSGQLKKPSNIGDGGYNMTGLRAEIGKDIPEVLPVVENK